VKLVDQARGQVLAHRGDAAADPHILSLRGRFGLL